MDYSLVKTCNVVFMDLQTDSCLGRKPKHCVSSPLFMHKTLHLTAKERANNKMKLGPDQMLGVSTVWDCGSCNAHVSSRVLPSSLMSNHPAIIILSCTVWYSGSPSLSIFGLELLSVRSPEVY